MYVCVYVCWGGGGGDNEKLCALEPLLLLKRFLPEADLEPRTTRSTGQCLIH